MDAFVANCRFICARKNSVLTLCHAWVIYKRTIIAPLVQDAARGRAVRALDSESKGPGFESAAGQHHVTLSKVLYS